MSPTSGNELAVLGSSRAGSGCGAGDAGTGGGAGAAAAGGGAGAGAGAAGGGVARASVACTSLSVVICGGFDVMIVALSLSPSRKSETCAGLPLAHDLHAALVHVALRERLDSVVGPHDDRPGGRLHAPCRSSPR